ncbi:MAG: gliding motility-associated C-terminal domain-containing protein, partial [Bacteroidales bacterium]|nr:gliding motility-associated C-terminal domain-containing protein [Bacteroidales bacterium]
VNGTGTWNDSNHWAETTGGNPGASIPTENDNVIFDNNSFITNNQTVIIKNKAICNDFRWEVDKYKPELKSSSFLFKSITKADLEVHGSLIIGKNIENEFFGDILLRSSKESIISSNAELNSDIIIQSKGGKYILEKALETNGNIELNKGSLITQGYNIECESFIGTGNKFRELNLGNSVIKVNSWDFAETKNLEFEQEKSIIIFKDQLKSKSVKLGNLDYYQLKTLSKAPQGSSKAAPVFELLEADSVECNGENNGKIYVKVSGGTTPYTFKLYTDAGFPVTTKEVQGPTTDDSVAFVTDIPIGKYWVWVTDDNNLDAIQSLNVYEPDIFSAGSITVTNPLTCFDGSDAELEANPSGGNPPYIYKWFKYNFGTSIYEEVVDSTRKVISGLSQGLYKVEVRDQKGCGTGGFVQTEYALIRGYDDVNVPDSIHISSITSTNSCTGSDNGTIDITASGGTGDIDYYLKRQSDSQFIPAGPPWDEDGSFTGLQADIYETYAIDANDCVKQGDNVTILDLPPATVDAGDDAETCEEVGIDLSTVLPTPASANNYSSLLWDDGGAAGTFDDASLLHPIYTPAIGQTGNVTLTLTANGNGNCPSVNDNMTLTITPAPVVDAGSDAETCEQVAIDLSTVLPTPASASNHSSLLWDDGGAPGAFDDASLLHPTYTPAIGQTGNVALTLTASGNGSCVSTNDNMTLTITVAPVVDAGDDAATCEEVAIDLSTVLPTPASASNYSSLLWDDGGAPGDFDDDSQLHPTYTPAVGQTGNVTLTLTANGNGTCASANDNMTLSITTKPVVDAGSDAETCEQVAIDLSTVLPTPASASNFSSLLWDDGGAPGTFDDASLLHPTYTPAVGQTGNVTLILTANGNGGCASENDNMTLTVYAAPVVDAGSDAETCEQVAIDLSTVLPTPASASNYSSLLWDDGGAPGTFDDASLLHPTYTPAVGQTGNVTLTLTANGNGGCASVNDNMTLAITVTPTVDAGSDAETCEQVAIDLSTVLPTPASASNYSSLLWDDGGATGTFDDASLLHPIYTPAVGQTGNVTLTLTANGNGTCASVNDNMTLTITPAPVVDAGSDAETCEQVAIDLSTVLPTPASASNYSSLLWDDGGAPGTFDDASLLHPTYTPAVGQTGNVTLTLTANGTGSCANVNDNMILTITVVPTVDAGDDAATCEEVAIDLSTVLPTPASASNYSSLLWDDGVAPGTFDDASLLHPTYTPAVGQTGNTTLTLTANGNGSCASVNDNMILTITPAPVVDAGSDAETCEQVAIDLSTVLPTPASASNYSSLLWDDGGAAGDFDDPALLHPTYTPAVGQTGNVTLTLTANGNGSCASANDNMTLTITPATVVDAGDDAATCEGVAIDLSTVLPTPASASNYSSLLWDDGGAPGIFDDASQLHPTYTPAVGQTGNVTLTLTASGTGSCASANDNMTLTITPAPVVDAGSDAETCEQVAIDLSTVIPTPASASNYSSLLWDDGGAPGAFDDASLLHPIYTPAVGQTGNVTLTLTANGNGGCASANDNMILTINAATVVDAGDDAETCEEVGIDLSTVLPIPASASNYSSLLWDDGGAAGDFDDASLLHPIYTPAIGQTGNVTLTLTANGNGSCASANDNMTLTITVAPTVDAGDDAVICEGTAIDLSTVLPTPASASNYSSLLWDDGGAPGTFDDASLLHPIYTPAVGQTGNTVLTLTANGNGSCASANDNMTLSITQAPIAYAGIDTTLCYGTLYYIQDADTTNSDGVTWEILTGNGSLDNINIIDPEYTPDVTDGGTIVELVIHASGKGTCADVTDTVRISYLSELLVAIGKPTPFYIDSTSTHIDVYVKLSGHKYIGNLGVFLVSPLDSVVELKTYCTAALPPNIQASTLRFYNDPLDSATISVIDSCTAVSGRYKFWGEWKKKLHSQDPANGSWRIRIGNNRNWGQDGLIEEATITFSDFNKDAVFESVLYADSSINLNINQWTGGEPSVTEYALPITGLTTSCFDLCDATAIATASGGQPPYVSYDWSTSLDFSAPFATGDTVDLCPGKFYVQVTDSHGCTAIDSVTVGAPPEIVITNDTVVHNTCNGYSEGKVMLEFSGGTGVLQYTYNGTDWHNSGDTIFNLGAAAYTFTIEDATGCTKDTLITITEPAAISISIDDITGITCHDAMDGAITISASGGVIPYNYSITEVPNFTNTTGIFTALDSGNVYIAVQDANMCIAYGDTIYFANPDTISIDSIKVIPTTCFGTGDDGAIIVYASGGVGTLEYSTDNITFQLNDTLKGLPIGDTTIYVRDDCGIKMLDSLVTVTGPIPIVIDSIIISDVSTCYGENTGQLTVYASGGTGNFEYSINGGTDYQASNTFTGLSARSYVIKVMDDDGCTSPDSTVNVGEPAELLISGLTVIHSSECNDPQNTGVITINATGGTGVYQYSIDNGDNWQAGSTFNNLDVGNYTLIVRDVNLCETTPLDTSIVLNPAMEIWLNKVDIGCNGENNGSIAVNFTVDKAGTPPYNYSWSTGASASIITGLSADWYYVTVTDSNLPDNCQDVDSVEITEPSKMDVILDSKDVYCINCDAIDPTGAKGYVNPGVTGGTPDYSYNWIGPGGFNSTSDFISNLDAGTYFLTVTDSRGCDSIIDVTISDNTTYDITNLDIDFDDYSVCWNMPATFMAGYNGYSDTIFYQIVENIDDKWIARDVSFVEINTNPMRVEDYLQGDAVYNYIRLTNQYCKNDVKNIDVTFFPDFELDIELDGISDNDTLYLKGTTSGNLGALVLPIADISFVWTPSETLSTPNSQATVVTPDESGWYKVVATSTNDCVDSSMIFLEFIPVITPNSGFSPNGDGINDYWKIKHIGKFKNNIVTVYSRWGVKVFEQKGYDNFDTSKSWDGNAKNGKNLPSGTYYYVIILNEEGFPPITGPITIIR